VKLHDLKPAPGSRKEKRRVGRGIAAGQGKTAGRGTKGQKARAGGTIPAWFEGGQTPLHQRIPKLRGFKNKFKIEYEVVNVGDIARLVEAGELEGGEMPGSKAAKGKAAPVTVNQEILRAVGLVRRLDRPMKILGGGDLSTALFVVADAVSGSARSKIEAAGGTVSLLEIPGEKRTALGVEDDHDHGDAEAHDAAASNADTEAAAPEAAAAAEAPEASEASASAEPDATAAPPATAGTKPPKPRAPRKSRTAEADTDA
jgi:large subunit ribosomal protein L15